MVGCKFYMQGQCKFGSRCRYDHAVADHGVHYSRSEDLSTNERPIGVSILKGGTSSFSGYQQSNQSSTIQFSQTPETLNFVRKNTSGSIGLFNVQEVMAMITRDVMQVVNGGQWQLSCYGPARDLPNVPGLDDYSPEEIRWECYKALSSNTLPLWQAMAQQLLTNATQTYSQLQHKDHLYALVDGWLRNIDSHHVPSQNMTPSFHGNVAPGLSLFNHPPNQSSTSSPFSFNLSGVQVGTTQIDSTVVSTDKNLFVTKCSGVPSLSIDSQAYSKPEELTEEDYEAFRADRFTINKIPTKPPAVTFCSV